MDFYDIINFSTYLSPILLIGGVGIGTYYFNKINLPHKIILFYLFAMLAIDLSARIYAEFYGSNLIFIPILAFAELFAFSVFYYYLGIKEHRLKYLFLISVNIATTIFMIWELREINNSPLHGFQSYSKIISTFLIALLSINLFVEKILTLKNISSELFFLNSVILMYFSMILIIFIPIDFLINDATGVKYYVWTANLLFTLVFYLLLIISLWKNGKIRV